MQAGIFNSTSKSTSSEPDLFEIKLKQVIEKRFFESWSKEKISAIAKKLSRLELRLTHMDAFLRFAHLAKDSLTNTIFKSSPHIFCEHFCRWHSLADPKLKNLVRQIIALDHPSQSCFSFAEYAKTLVIFPLSNNKAVIRNLNEMIELMDGVISEPFVSGIPGLISADYFTQKYELLAKLKEYQTSLLKEQMSEIRKVVVEKFLPLFNKIIKFLSAESEKRQLKLEQLLRIRFVSGMSGATQSPSSSNSSSSVKTAY